MSKALTPLIVHLLPETMAEMEKIRQKLQPQFEGLIPHHALAAVILEHGVADFDGLVALSVERERKATKTTSNPK